MTLLAKVLPMTLEQNPCARVFDMLLGGGAGDRPAQRDSRGVLIRLILVALDRVQDRVLATEDMMDVMLLFRELPKELSAEMEAFVTQAEYAKMPFTDGEVALLRHRHEVEVDMEAKQLSKLRTLR
jgi:hypothetical protein